MIAGDARPLAFSTTRRSDDFARNQGILVEGIHGAHSMVTVGNDDLAIALVTHEQERRELVARQNAFAVFFYVRIADTEKRQTGRPEKVLRLEFRRGRPPELPDIFRRHPLFENQAQIRLGRRVVMFFRLAQPGNLNVLAHVTFSNGAKKCVPRLAARFISYRVKP